MSTRTYSLVALALLAAGCGRPDPKPTQSALAAIAAAHGAASGGIACAHGAGQALAPDCTIERMPTQDGTILTLRHPDGGFRRLRVTKDGHGVVAADGAQPAGVRIVSPHEIEVTLGGNRYRLPATVAAAGVPAARAR